MKYYHEISCIFRSKPETDEIFLSEKRKSTMSLKYTVTSEFLDECT